MFDKIKEFITNWNVLGVNIPLAKEPKTNTGSYTATLVVISSLCVILSLVSPKIDKSGAMVFYTTSACLYLGRKFSNNKNKE